MSVLATEPQEVVLRSRGFAGGSNLKSAINQLQANQARRLENVLLSEKGAVEKRTGCQARGVIGPMNAHRVLSMFTFYRGGSTPQLIVHTTEGKVRYCTNPDAGSPTWNDITTGRSTTDPFNFEVYNGNLYFTNATDGYFKWTGTVFSAPAGAPKGKFLKVWKDAMWMGGSNDDRIQKSDIGDADTFGAASWVDIGKGDGDRVSGLGTNGDFLIVGKKGGKGKTFIINDPVTFANKLVDHEKGIEGHNSIISHDGEIYYLTRRGVVQWRPDGPAKLVSGLIDPFFDPAVINFNAMDTVVAYTHGDRVGWSIAEVGQLYPTVQIEYYPRMRGLDGLQDGPWAFHRMPCRAFATYRSGASERLYAGDNGSEAFLWCFSTEGQDRAVKFAGVIELGSFDLGDPVPTKYLRRARFLGRGKFYIQIKRNWETQVYRTILVDMSSTADTWNVAETWSGVWGPDSVYKEDELNLDLYGRNFSVRITDAEYQVPATRPLAVGDLDVGITGGAWSLQDFMIEGKMLGNRR